MKSVYIFPKETYNQRVNVFPHGKFYCLSHGESDSEIIKMSAQNVIQKDNEFHQFLHRLDGPAAEYTNGDKKWWYEGEEIKCSSQQEFEKLLKLKAFW